MTPRNLIFDSFAAEYDLFRPKYPVAIAQEIARRIELSPNARLLEIGCGSGQATAAFANLGCNIEALDPSESLIAIARQNLSGQKQTHFHCQTFEDYESPATKFDF